MLFSYEQGAQHSVSKYISSCLQAHSDAKDLLKLNFDVIFNVGAAGTIVTVLSLG